MGSYTNTIIRFDGDMENLQNLANDYMRATNEFIQVYRIRNGYSNNMWMFYLCRYAMMRRSKDQKLNALSQYSTDGFGSYAFSNNQEAEEFIDSYDNHPEYHNEVLAIGISRCAIEHGYLIMEISEKYSHSPASYALLADIYNLEYVYLSESCECGIFVNTDIGHKYFTPRYSIFNVSNNTFDDDAAKGTTLKEALHKFFIQIDAMLDYYADPSVLTVKKPGCIQVIHRVMSNIVIKLLDLADADKLEFEYAKSELEVIGMKLVEYNTSAYEE